jgi:hypothetical protein
MNIQALADPILSQVGTTLAPRVVAAIVPPPATLPEDDLAIEMRAMRAKEFLNEHALQKDPAALSSGVWAGCLAAGLLLGVGAGVGIFGTGRSEQKPKRRSFLPAKRHSTMKGKQR